MAAIEEQEQYTEVYSSVFAPAEVKRRSNLMVQVYLHLFEESENIKTMASETDRNATRRDYNALDMKLKSGDKVDVAFSVTTISISIHSKIVTCSIICEQTYTIEYAITERVQWK